MKAGLEKDQNVQLTPQVFSLSLSATMQLKEMQKMGRDGPKPSCGFSRREG